MKMTGSDITIKIGDSSITLTRAILRSRWAPSATSPQITIERANYGAGQHCRRRQIDLGRGGYRKRSHEDRGLTEYAGIYCDDSEPGHVHARRNGDADHGQYAIED